jgi:hypothetical protein
MCLFFHLTVTDLESSLTSTQHSLRRGLRRMIDMFNPVRDLIAKSDRRTTHLEDGEETVFTEE